jgi:hypothetical protein
MTPTGKAVIWGHWIVGLLAAAITVASIWGIVGNTVSMEHGARFGPQVLIADSQLAVLGMICALCAWGILRWRPWGHVLALGIFTVELFVGGLALWGLGSVISPCSMLGLELVGAPVAPLSLLAKSSNELTRPIFADDGSFISHRPPTPGKSRTRKVVLHIDRNGVYREL